MSPDVSTTIINVDTVGYTALAALSARRHLPFPVRVIDCSRHDEQAAACERLADELELGYARWPLRPHGETLDRLFSESSGNWTVLLDSDAEILDGEPFRNALDAAIAGDGYGLGWVQPTGRAVEAGTPITLYMERPWVPFCAFSVDRIRTLLAAGASFQARLVRNDLRWLPARLRRLAAFRRHVPGLRSVDLRALQTGQREVDGDRPPYIYFDTAASMHRAARRAGWHLDSLPWEAFRSSVFHVHGGTRKLLNRLMPNAARRRPSMRRALDRIRTLYASVIPERLVRAIDRAERAA